jgi:protein involved in temperature-dependent protein secretion
MGECKLQTGNIKDAIQFFTNVVRARPKNVSGWEALIRCLYNVEYYEEALEQVFCCNQVHRWQAAVYLLPERCLFCHG